MEKKATREDEIHVIVFPFPIQGHINPMLQFSKQLASRGLRVTFATTSSIVTKITPFNSNSTTIEIIPDDATETTSKETIGAHIKRFNDFAPPHLAQLIEKKLRLRDRVRCLVYDSAVPWGLDIARKFGIHGAPYFTQSCLVNLLYYQVHHGMLSTPIEEEETSIGVDGMPVLGTRDVPSFVGKVGLYPSLERLVLDQFSNCADADWVFFNSVHGLESKVTWIEKGYRKREKKRKKIVMEGENIEQKPRRGAHVLVFPSPLQGHINPMLQFSKRLAFKGLQVTFITTSSITSPPSLSSPPNIEFVRIFDGFREGHKVVDLDAYRQRMRTCISRSLLELIDHYKQKRGSLNPTPKVVIYDSFMPWVLDMIKENGLTGGPFFTQSCMVNSIYCHLYKGALTIPIDRSLVSLPAIKEFLRVDDLPGFVSSPTTYPSLLRLVLDQFSNFEEANCSFINTVDKLEIEVVDWMASKMPVKTIGPAIPSMYLDKRLPDDKDYGLSLFEPEADICIPWLDAKEEASVVYVSMGSLASLAEEQMEEMAVALERCNKYFLWVVRASEEDKLPPDFKERTSQKGLVVNWCPQLEVLAHRAVGCFVTHCGWNSTLEAISLGVPMVAFPQWTDQPTNAKCIADFWKVGVRVKVNENGIVTREEMEYCIRQVMEGERGEQIKSNASNMKQVVKEAMEEGGSSDRNIQEFVAKLSET
ncbi:hypothetical protein Cgig2_018969 [Carnegiea gigantea]|uniref:Glycosyltransferase N-terminal domain-containing protein n=1 Tax=Carnegiea gigantea TaxID=171969 RepID=A0A9Q1K2A0_9CARY|nr:hypothetical protein Cgig2_018969 [Carnegiea gigantea]